jgi:hypothetical protein
MAYSINPFSVATFGESYEQADIAVVPTGVVGTGVINGAGLDVSSRTNVDLTGTQGDGAIGAPTPQAEATTGALTGVQATGVANTVTASGGTGVIFTPSNVSATGAANTVTIVAKAVTVPTGVEGDIITDDPLVTGDEIIVDAEATFAVTSAGLTSSFNGSNITIVAKAVVVPTGVEGDIITDSILINGDEVVIDAEADVDLTGVSATVNVNENVILVCKAVVLPTGAQGTLSLGDETIDAVQFDYESIKDDYSRQRTVYVQETSNVRTTSYVRAA